MSGYRSYRPPRARHTRSRQQHTSEDRTRNGGDDVDILNDETFGSYCMSSDGDWEETHRRFAELDLKSRGITKSSLDDNNQDLDLERALSKLVDDEDEKCFSFATTGNPLVSQFGSPTGLNEVSDSVSSDSDNVAGLQSIGLGGFASNAEMQQSLSQQKQSTESMHAMTSSILPPGLSGKVLTVAELEQRLTSQDKESVVDQVNDLAQLFPSVTSQQMSSVVGHQSAPPGLPPPPGSQQNSLDPGQSNELAQMFLPVTSQHLALADSQQSSPPGLLPSPGSQQNPRDDVQLSSMSHSLPSQQEGISSSLKLQSPAAHMSSVGQQVPMPFAARGSLLLPQIPNSSLPFPLHVPSGIPPRLAHHFTHLLCDPRLSVRASRMLPPHFTHLPPGVLSPFLMPRVQGMPWMHLRGPAPNPVQEPVLVGLSGSHSSVMGSDRSQLCDLLSHELEFSSSTAEDPYAGLMTQKEKDYIIKIQMMQLQSQNPFADDYYYQMITVKRREKELRQEAKDRGIDSDDQERDKENTKIIIPSVTVETREYKPPVNSEGSLGKITIGSITSPRKTLDVHPVSSGHLTKLDAYPSLRRKLLITIENMYQLLLEIDELERRAQALPDTDASQLERVATKNREKLLELIGIDSLNESACYVNDTDFVHLMAIRKGRAVIGRLLRVLSQQHGQMILIKMFLHIGHILKRDLQDLPSSLATASDSVTAAIRSASMKVVVHVTSCLAASEDLVCDFAAHVVDACVSRASELLFEDPSCVDMWSTCCTDFCNQAGALIVSMQRSDSSRLLTDVLISHPYVPINWQTTFRQLSNNC